MKILEQIKWESTYKGILESTTDLYKINDVKNGDYYIIGEDVYYRINDTWKHYNEIFPKVVCIYEYNLEVDKDECARAASNKYFNIIANYNEYENLSVDEKQFKFAFELGAKWMVEQIYKNEIK